MTEEFLTTEDMAKGLEALAARIEETFGGNDQSRLCRVSAARMRELVRTIDRLRVEPNARIAEPRESVSTSEKSYDEPIWGAAKIGKTLGLNSGQAAYLLKVGKIGGARKIGRKWFATRRMLFDHIATNIKDSD